MKPLLDQWMPIDSAPKDGTCLLAFIPFEWANGEKCSAMDVVAWDARAGFWFHPTPPNYVQGCAAQPTHWMPLPPPPSIAAKEG